MEKPDLDSLYQRFVALMRARDYEAAVNYFKERVSRAIQRGDEEETTVSAQLLISSLTAAGPEQEAISLLWRVVDSLGGSVYLRSSFAGFLLSFLNEPAQALEVLDPAFDELVTEEGSRHATLGLRGAILVALGRAEEAGRYLLDMLQAPLRRMEPRAFDFRLVESLVTRGLMEHECELYLNIVHRRAHQIGDREVMARADQLLRRFR